MPDLRKPRAAAVVLILILGCYYLWFGLARPVQLTEAHGEELAAAVAHFRTTELAIETRLQPELLLSVATASYLPTFREMNEWALCDRCDRFLVSIAAETPRVRVLAYTPQASKVRAEVVWRGYRVNARTYEPLSANVIRHTYVATYRFVRPSPDDPWRVFDISELRFADNLNPNALTVDDFLLLDVRTPGSGEE